MKKFVRLLTAFGLAVSTLGFANSILAGSTLARTAMQSEGFTSGVQGWRIARNGDAEFNNLIARGSFISGDGSGKHITIDGTLGSELFYTGDPQEAAPGEISATTDNGGFPLLSMLLSSPEGGAPTQVAQIQLTSQTNNANGSFIDLLAENVGMSDAIEISTNETWHNVTLLNSWATLGGLTPQYRKGISGDVSLIGRISGGTTGVIASLPVGYRPKQTLDFVLKSNGDASSVSWIQINSSGTITAVGNVAAAQVWLSVVLTFSSKA